MENKKIEDKGGRRLKVDRRSHISFDPVLEKRKAEDRRCGSDRRYEDDPVIRITGDERRKVFRDIDL